VEKGRRVADTRAFAIGSGTKRRLSPRAASTTRKSATLANEVVAIGRLRARGKESGAETDSPVAWVVEFKNGKVIQAQAYLDPKEALEAAGLRD
jgi:ketosteroid isomerase-like protein